MANLAFKWLNHYRRHALAARDQSKDATKVGAALIGPDSEVLLTAYNGPAMKVIDTPARRSRCENGIKYKYAAHAERNLIAFAAKRGISTDGLTVYTTHHPCSACAAELIQAGIKCVIIGPETFASADGDVDHAGSMLYEASVAVIKHDTSLLLDKADAFAKAMLADKLDKNGISLYYHSKRVAEAIPIGFSPIYRVIAMLHDVVEEVWPEESNRLIGQGVIYSLFGQEVSTALALLTRGSSSYEDYIKDICASGISTVIVAKLFDVRDNLDRANDHSFTNSDSHIESLKARYTKADRRLTAIFRVNHPYIAI